MHSKRAYLPVSINKGMKQSNAFHRLNCQGIIYRIATAGVRLVFVIKLMLAFGVRSTWLNQ